MSEMLTAELLPNDSPKKFDQRHEQRLINDILELLVTHHGGSMSEEELDLNLAQFHQAIDLARASHTGQLRKSGEP